MEGDKTDLKIDRLSFQLGMINCFAEMVANGVKSLAISPPLLPEDYEAIKEASDKIVKAFGIKSYLEKSLLVTDLQSEDFTSGRWAILYFEEDEVIRKYMDLKEKKSELEKDGRYDHEARKQISREFMRLLSYPDDKIEQILSRPAPKSPFVLADQEGEES
jgi:hypothetical protein